MLVERLAVIAVNYPNGVVLQSPGAQTFDERAERNVSIVEGIAVLIDLGCSGERTSLRSGVRMMAGDRQIGQEKLLATGDGVDPCEHPRDGRRFVDSEARIQIA